MQLNRSVRLRKQFSGENKERKSTKLQETQVDQIFYHYQY